MIEAIQATQYIAQRIENLIQGNQIKGKLKKSKTSISIYLRSKDSDTPPPKYFRGSNHHPKLSNLLRYNWKPWDSKNICIEFGEPRYDEGGKKLDNRWNDSVKQTYPATIKPFNVDVYIYKAANLDETDIPAIFEALKNFVFTGSYIDPFVDDELKKAKHVTREAKIKPYQESPGKSRNITIYKDGTYDSANAWGADYISENSINIENKILNYNMKTNKKALYESIMKDVCKSVKTQLYDNYLNDNYSLYEDIIRDVSKIVDNHFKRNLLTEKLADEIREIRKSGVLTDHMKDEINKTLKECYSSGPKDKVCLLFYDSEDDFDAIKLNKHGIPVKTDSGGDKKSHYIYFVKKFASTITNYLQDEGIECIERQKSPYMAYELNIKD